MTMQEQSENAIKRASIKYLESLIEENKKDIARLQVQNIQFKAEVENRQDTKFWRDTNDL